MAISVCYTRDVANMQARSSGAADLSRGAIALPWCAPWCRNYRYIIANTNCIPVRERLAMARPRGESKRTGTSPPRAAIIQRSRRVQCHKLSVTHRPTCRVLARPRRIKNSRCNDRYFSTGHRDRAYCLTETDWRNGGASAGAARVISLDGQRGCKTDKYYGRADCAYTSTRLPFSLHCYRLPSTYLKISGISVPSMRIIISRRSLFFFLVEMFEILLTKTAAIFRPVPCRGNRFFNEFIHGGSAGAV